jgi:hypothetical protein
MDEIYGRAAARRGGRVQLWERSILISVLFCLAFGLAASVSHANNLPGSQAPTISTTLLSPDEIDRIKARCDERSILNRPLHSSFDKCKKAFERPLFNSTVLNHCMEKRTANEFAECLAGSSGRDYPYSYLKACSRAGNASGEAFGECLNYLAKTPSSFDQESFQLCLERGMTSRFKEALTCLNSIRDRQANVQLLRNNCVSGHSAFGERFEECVARVSEDFQLSAYCSPRASGGAADGRPASPPNPEGRFKSTR